MTSDGPPADHLVRAVTVLWARHGQNQANVTRQLSHRTLDLDLTDVGRAQALALADSLAARAWTGPPALFTSPLRRARQTADIVAGRLGGKIVEIDALRELDVGELDGRSDAAAWTAYESVLAHWSRGGHDARFAGGESWHELCARLHTALRHVADNACGQPAVVIAHGANIRAALPGLAGVADPGADLGTGQVAELEVITGAAAAQIRLRTWPSASP